VAKREKTVALGETWVWISVLLLRMGVVGGLVSLDSYSHLETLTKKPYFVTCDTRGAL
jgi:hypothetical protein